MSNSIVVFFLINRPVIRIIFIKVLDFECIIMSVYTFVCACSRTRVCTMGDVCVCICVCIMCVCVYCVRAGVCARAGMRMWCVCVKMICINYTCIILRVVSNK